MLVRPAIEDLTPYQPGKPIEDVQRELGLERIVKLASNEGPFPPFPAALEAMERAARELNRYPDGGSYRLHEALAARHGVAFEQIAVGAGADGCLDMLSQATLDPGDEVVCCWPSFPSYVIYARKQGASALTVPLREQRYDLDALAAAVTARTKLVFICHPNNPTGTMNTREDRKSTRLNSSHPSISYAVFCVKKKKMFADNAGRIGRAVVFETDGRGSAGAHLGFGDLRLCSSAAAQLTDPSRSAMGSHPSGHP